MKTGWISLFLSENIKHRHTLNGKAWFLAPMITVSLAYGISGRSGNVSAYNWWYTLLLPGMLTLCCCLACEKDRKMQNRAILALPESPGRIWDVKILTGIKSVLFANIMMVCLILLLGEYLMPEIGVQQSVSFRLGQSVEAMLIMTEGFLWQIPFCFWIDQKFGILPTMCLNMLLNVSGTIMAVTGWWILNPWAIVPRLMTVIIGILPNGLPAIPGSMTYSKGITDPSAVPSGVIAGAIWLVVMWWLTRKWYENKGAQML